MRRIPRIATILIGLGVLLVLGGSAPPITTDVAAFAHLGGYECMNSGSISEPLGVPAIQPHIPGVPAFTKDDVRAYIEAYGFQGLKIGSNGQATITEILFITSHEACELMQGENVGLPDDALVCYVEFSGTFFVSGPPVLGTPTPSPQPLSRGNEVFDARTGNLLIVGIMP